MKSKLLFTIKKQCHLAGLTRAMLMALLGFMILPAMAQIGTYYKDIFISGQITNSMTGAPIPDHEVYIQSDSSLNNGFVYYATAKTDVNGFYWDTITTTSNDGIINFYIYDFNNNRIELDRYYRFIWESEYVMIADLPLYDPNTNTELQANFEAQSDTLEENPLKIIFSDRSYGETIKSWKWEFGDGSYSEDKDPVHVYDKSGLYMVKLTISALPSGFEHYLQSTIIKQVHVGYGVFYHVGGHVFADYFPIDLGLAYLYAYDEEDALVPIDTTRIDTLGYYYFYQLPAGKYLTKARLQDASVLYGEFMPTYLGNVYSWDQALSVTLENNNWECDIALLQSTGTYSGKGLIIGQIVYDTSMTDMGTIPAGDIEILLLSEQGNNITCNLSDMEGYFTFSDIAFGTYQLFPDLTGILNAPMFLTLSEDKPLISNFSLVIHSGEIFFAISETESEFLEKALMIYPNPAKDQTRISVQMKKASPLAIMITDMQGREVYYQNNTLNPGPNELMIDLKQLPSGCFNILLIPQDKKIISGKLLKFN